MAYTNSKLVDYTKLSPNHSGLRTHAIDRISPHCVVGQCSVETLGNIFADRNREASSNYGIGYDGRVGMYVEEKNRSWCTSSNSNDQRAITIECASDTTEPYTMNSAVYESLVKLCTDICKRNGKQKLLWFGDKNKTLNYVPKSDEMVLTVHRWFANKSCPGDWLYNRLGDLAKKVTANLRTSLNTKPSSSNKNTSSGNTVNTKQTTVDIEYQVYANGKWLPYVKNTNDFAGIENKSIQGIRMKVSKGHIKYRVKLVGSKNYLPWVTDTEDYAGIIGKDIDCVQANLVGVNGYKVQYRVSTINSKNYLPWVTNYNNSNSDGYAGIKNIKIDKFQAKIVKS